MSIVKICRELLVFKQFMHVLDVMQSNLVETGMIGDEKRYSSLAICDVRADESQAENEGKEEE